MLKEGSNIGGYTILGELGRGAQAVVFLARPTPTDADSSDSSSAELVAIKAYFEDFRHEARAPLAELAHPAICKIHDHGREDGIAYAVMDYIDGESLASRIRAASTPLPLEEMQAMLRALEDVADGLAHAHDAGVVHGDVKASNILIRPDGRAVLIDLGLAHETEAGDTSAASSGPRGSPPYLAPEIVRGASGSSPAHDLWALAVTSYECLALRRPFAGPTREALYRAILVDEAPRLHAAVDAQMRPALELVLRRALDKDPSRRYATARDFASELHNLRLGKDVRAKPPTLGVRLRRALARNQPWVIVAACVLLALTATVAMLVETAAAARVSARAFASEQRTTTALREQQDWLAFLLHYDELQSLERERQGFEFIAPEQLGAMRAWRRRADDLLAQGARLRPDTERDEGKRALRADFEARLDGLAQQRATLFQLEELTDLAVVRHLSISPRPIGIVDAGDIDGDGCSDILLNLRGRQRAFIARAELISGRDGSRLWSCASNDPQTASWKVRAVTGGADLDSDGRDDFAIGYRDTSDGHCYVRAISGRTLRLIFVRKLGARGDGQLSSLAALPDIDGDGGSELLIGRPSKGEHGCVDILSGSDGRLLRSQRGSGKDGAFGHALAVLDDLDGDDYADYIVGAHASNEKAARAGSAYVFSGKDGRRIFAKHGGKARDLFGWSVADAGDVDADGVRDFMVGADWEEGRLGAGNAGAVHVYSGRSGERLHHLLGSRAKGLFGYTLACAGDVDADGHADLLIGCPGTRNGYAYVYSGRDASLLLELGDTRYIQYGTAVVRLTDSNGDGTSEIAISSSTITKHYAKPNERRGNLVSILQLASYFRRRRP